MALTMPILLLAVAGAVEVVHWTVVQRTLQRTADLAALAGAVAYFDAVDPREAAMAAVDHAGLNGLPILAGQDWDADARSLTGDGIAVRIGPGVHDSDGVTVQVSLVLGLSTFLSQLSSHAIDLRVHADAWAEVRNSAQPCILALAPDGRGVVMEGDRPFTLSGCAVRSNAGISAGGTPITAYGFYARGAIDGRAVRGALHPDDGTIADPYAGEAAMRQAFDRLRPEEGPPVRIESGTGQSLHPGTYSDWRIEGDTRLEPGFYQVNGDISIGPAGRLQGRGVTIISSGTIQMTRGASLSLAAPGLANRDGPLHAVAYASRTLSAVRIEGDRSVAITGTVYLPNADLHFTGVAHGGRTGCLRLIAKSVTLRSGAETGMAAYCQTVGGRGFTAEDRSVRAELVR
jgi:Putative Flp pilus-assembly TadE/G-like